MTPWDATDVAVSARSSVSDLEAGGAASVTLAHGGGSCFVLMGAKPR